MKKIFLILLTIISIQFSIMVYFAEAVEQNNNSTNDYLSSKEADPAPMIRSVVKEFEERIGSMKDGLIVYAKRLFGILALIQFTYNMGMLAINGKTDMQSFASVLLRQIMIIGIFYFLLSHGPSIFKDIIDSFSKAAATSGNFSEELDPTGIYTAGSTLALKLQNLDWVTPDLFASDTNDRAQIYVSLLCFLLTTSFATIAAIYTLIMIKGYFICTSGMLFLGFGGSEWSNDVAKSTLKAVFSIGAETFVILVIASIANTFVKEWSNRITDDMTRAQFVIACGPISTMTFILAALATSVPGMAAGLISGSAIGSGGTGTVASAAAGQATSRMTTDLHKLNGLAGGGKGGIYRPAENQVAVSPGNSTTRTGDHRIQTSSYDDTTQTNH